MKVKHRLKTPMLWSAIHHPLKRRATSGTLVKLIQTNSSSEVEKLLPQLSEEGRQIARRAMEKNKP